MRGIFFSTEKKAEQDVALRMCCCRCCPETLISMYTYIIYIYVAQAVYIIYI